MKRFSKTIPGHDCVRFPCGKGDCGKTSGGNHGVCDDTWIYAVSDGDVALSLRVASAVFPESIPRSKYIEEAKPRGVLMHVHAAFPVERESVRNGDTGQPCEYVDRGLCFAVGEGYGVAAEAVFKELDSGAQGLEQPEAFWVGLEAAWKEYAANAYEQRVDMFVRCNHCDGLGTVTRPA